MHIVLDPEFESLIPKLRPQELEMLETSLLREGCHDSLKIWGNGGDLLLDGHNRYRFCTQHKISFGTEQIQLPNRNAALLWIEENQLSRRNLSDDRRAMMLESIRKRRSALVIKERNKANGGGRKSVGETVSSTSTERTRTALARENNLPEWKLRSAQEVSKARPDLAAKVLDGDLSLNEAKREIRKDRHELCSSRGRVPGGSSRANDDQLTYDQKLEIVASSIIDIALLGPDHVDVLFRMVLVQLPNQYQSPEVLGFLGDRLKTVSGKLELYADAFWRESRGLPATAEEEEEEATQVLGGANDKGTTPDGQKAY